MSSWPVSLLSLASKAATRWIPNAKLSPASHLAFALVAGVFNVSFCTLFNASFCTLAAGSVAPSPATEGAEADAAVWTAALP